MNFQVVLLKKVTGCKRSAFGRRKKLNHLRLECSTEEWTGWRGCPASNAIEMKSITVWRTRPLFIPFTWSLISQPKPSLSESGATRISHRSNYCFRMSVDNLGHTFGPASEPFSYFTLSHRPSHPRVHKNKTHLTAIWTSYPEPCRVSQAADHIWILHKQLSDLGLPSTAGVKQSPTYRQSLKQPTRIFSRH